MLDCSAAVCSLYQQHHRTLAKSLVHTNRLGQVLTGLTCTSHPVDLCCMREKSSRDAQGAMGTRRLCLIAWTVATGIVTGAVPGSDSQCIADSRPAHLIAEPNRTSSFTVQSLANNASCEWLISSNTISTRLRLTAAIFNLRSYNGSCVDNFTVFDGNSSSSPILLSTCSTLDFPIYSSGSDVLVSFTTGSDDSWETSDFVINYEVFGFSTCASDVLLRAVYRNPQYLEYPENNQNYTNNADYGWLVQTSRDDYVVHVTFMFVSTESGRDCSYDYIDVYDGTSALSRKLVRLCGMLAMQREVYSSGQSLLIRFHSDSTETGQGFRLLYTAVSRSEGPQDSDKMCSHHREVNTTTHLLIYSTSFTDSANCSWLLQTSINDYVVHVTFTYVNMQTTDNCSHDYVELFDLSSSAHSLGKVCQSTSRDFYSSASSMGSSIGSSMYIKFRSDAITAGRGFMLTYQAVPRSSLPTTTASTCSRYPPPLTARRYNEEYLQYPTTSSSYPSNVDCGWVLVTTFDNYVVHVTFTFVNVEYASYCPYDYIEVFDGSSDVTNSLGRLCGSQVGDFYSSGQSMYIKFHSDASTSGGGFRLTYKAVSTWDVPKPSASVSPAVVVGAVVGSIAFLIAVIVVAVTCRRRRLQQSTRNPPINTNNNQPIVYFYPPNGSALQAGPPSFLPAPPAVMAGPPSVFAVPPSVIASPPSLNTGPPSYDFLVQGARYPGVSGQVVHTSSMPQFPVTGPAPSASPGARVSKF